MGKGHKKISLTQGKYAIVDAEDYDYIKKWKWYYSKNRGGYAVREEMRQGKKKLISMHRVINKTPTGMVTDHINGNTLDNRKKNLRNATIRQNTQNQRIRENKSSKYKGVYWYKAGRKWRAQMQSNKKRIYLGQYDSEIEAAKAYNEGAIKYFGKYARLNTFGDDDIA